MEQLPQEVQIAFMTLLSRVVELEWEALTKNGVIENLQKLISERNLQNLLECFGIKVLKEYSGKESGLCDWEFDAFRGLL